MKHMEAILAAAIALSLTGCVLRGKPQPTTASIPVAPKPTTPSAPPPPPAQLSIPQTQVELPPAQPVSQEAQASLQSAEDTPSPIPVPPKPKRQQRQPVVAAEPARTETVGPATPPPATSTPAVESERPNIQEILSPQELSRLQADAAKSKREIQQRLDQARRRRLSSQDQALREEVLSYLRLSNEAEKQGDMRKAYELAERGLVRAKDLNGGK